MNEPKAPTPTPIPTTSDAFAAAPGSESLTGLTGGEAGARASSSTTSGAPDPEAKSVDVGGVIQTPQVQRALGELPADDPQVRAANAPPPDASAWQRRPLDTPQERFDNAVKERLDEANKVV